MYCVGNKERLAIDDAVLAIKVGVTKKTIQNKYHRPETYSLDEIQKIATVLKFTPIQAGICAPGPGTLRQKKSRNLSCCERRLKQMHEINKRTTGTLSAMQPDLNISRFAVIHGEYICPKCTKEGAVLKGIHIRIERQSTLFDVMEKAGSVIGGLASLGMVYVLGCMVVRFWILI